ncbi:MAG: response regulator [Bdellovibrionales bacterium]|nr:response regulator [Bdellovibrionales bacterium]
MFQRQDRDPKEQAVAEWLGARRVLVADVGPSTRACITRVLQELGARPPHLKVVNGFAAAVEAMADHRPHIVICDYHLAGTCGLRLAPLLKRLHPEGRDRLFVLVTVNSSQSVVAEAAEEDVDRYVLKPFTHEGLRDYLFQSVTAKLHPGPYIARIERGKAALARKEFDNATLLFTEATIHSERPALAYYYLAQAYLAEGRPRDAEEHYRAGLVFNEIHYRCLTGLFELLRSEYRCEEAYEVMKVLLERFPVSPRRLDAAVSLAVETGHFDHVGRYFEVYTGLEFKPENLAQAVSRALIEGGRHFLGNERVQEAVDVFQKASVTANKHTLVLRRIITSLVEHGKHQEAERFLKDFPPEHQRGSDYLSMDLLIGSALGTVSRTIDQGRRLLRSGLQDQVVYETLIRTSIKAGLLESAEGLVYDAARIWPEERERFERYLSKASGAQAA